MTKMVFLLYFNLTRTVFLCVVVRPAGPGTNAGVVSEGGFIASFLGEMFK